MESICRINVSNNGYYEVICLDKIKISLLNELLAKIAFEMIRITKTDGNKNHICLSKERFDLANKLAKDETELSDFFRNLSYSPFSIENISKLRNSRKRRIIDCLYSSLPQIPHSSSKNRIYSLFYDQC